MSNFMYNIAYDELSSGGGTDWLLGAVQVRMCTAAYVPLAAHSYVSDLTNELAGFGYAPVALANKTRTLSVSGEILTTSTFIDFGIIGAGAGTPGWLIVCRTTGVAATSPLLGYYPMPPTPGDGVQAYHVNPPTDGLFLLGPADSFTLPEMLTFKSGS